MRKIIPLAAAICVALLSVSAVAQTPPPDGTPTRIRGTVERLDGQSLTVRSREGQDVTIALAPNYSITALVKKNVADIKSGDFVASTGVKGTDGKLHAIEVRIFPEALRGVGEGQYAWDLKPDSTMTNATVAGIAGAGTGQTLKVNYKGSESEYVVDADCPVFGYTQGDPSLLKPGAAVFVIALKKADGSLTAARLTAEKDGIKPPM